MLQNLLAPGIYNMADEANNEWMQIPFILQPKGPSTLLLTIVLKPVGPCHGHLW